MVTGALELESDRLSGLHSRLDSRIDCNHCLETLLQTLACT